MNASRKCRFLKIRKSLSFLGLYLFFFSCNAQKKEANINSETNKTYTVTKTDNEWKAQLTDFQYYILRKAGTERAFTGKYNKHYKKGVYECVACNNALYKSEHKFDSGTGWPSFDRAVKGNVRTSVDYKLGYARRELLCNTCGGHLGHVFNDGPKATTGKRHCINSAALIFKPSANE